jgi:hypothetical protein
MNRQTRGSSAGIRWNEIPGRSRRPFGPARIAELLPAGGG